MPRQHASESVACYRVNNNHLGHYQQTLSQLLQNIYLPPALFCKELQWTDEQYQDQISKMCDDISTYCLEAWRRCLPKWKSKHRHKPGWAADVQPYKEASIMWHNMWMELGEPQVGEVFENRKEAKSQLPYACRRLKRQEHFLKNEKMAEAISQNRSKDFLKR